MGKYDDTEADAMSYDFVGLTQLEDSIALFLEGKYLSSITLAGAADVIFSDLRKRQGSKNQIEETWDSIVRHREKVDYKVAVNPETGEEYTKKEAIAFWNRTRNSLKHHDKKTDGDALVVNLVDESYDWLLRAISSAEIIGLEPDNLNEFRNNTFPRFHM